LAAKNPDREEEQKKKNEQKEPLIKFDSEIDQEE
jgi:hypothetical protein